MPEVLVDGSLAYSEARVKDLCPCCGGIHASQQACEPPVRKVPTDE
jgi:hypothetical protein